MHEYVDFILTIWIWFEQAHPRMGDTYGKPTKLCHSLWVGWYFMFIWLKLTSKSNRAIVAKRQMNTFFTQISKRESYRVGCYCFRLAKDLARVYLWSCVTFCRNICKEKNYESPGHVLYTTWIVIIQYHNILWTVPFGRHYKRWSVASFTSGPYGILC